MEKIIKLRNKYNRPQTNTLKCMMCMFVVFVADYTGCPSIVKILLTCSYSKCSKYVLTFSLPSAVHTLLLQHCSVDNIHVTCHFVAEHLSCLGCWCEGIKRMTLKTGRKWRWQTWEPGRKTAFSKLRLGPLSNLNVSVVWTAGVNSSSCLLGNDSWSLLYRLCMWQNKHLNPWILIFMSNWLR